MKNLDTTKKKRLPKEVKEAIGGLRHYVILYNYQTFYGMLHEYERGEKESTFGFKGSFPKEIEESRLNKILDYLKKEMDYKKAGYSNGWITKRFYEIGFSKNR